jgi:hypothetical protein
MSVEVLLGDMVHDAVEQAMAPFAESLANLIARLSAVFAPGALPAVSTKERGAGRPKKAAAAVSDEPVKRGRGRPKKVAEEGTPTFCAIKGCGRLARSKGFCAAHYQKFRMLEKTNRLPPDWVADAAPNSIENIMLPKIGRAHV